MKKHLIFTILLISTLIVLPISIILFMNKKPEEQMSYPVFLQAIDQQEVKSISFIDGNKNLKIQLKNDDKMNYIVPNPQKDDFTEFLLLNNIEIKSNSNNLFQQSSKIILLIFIFLGVYFVIKKRNHQSFEITDKTKQVSKERVTLNQVAGNAEAKSMVEDIIDFIKTPDKYSSVGARMPKGLLFYGPPGTGKTLMAKAIAGEADIPFYSMSGSDFVQMYVGVGASRIRSLFKKAKKDEKAIIFIDEIDAIGKKRGRNSSASNDERDQTLNALLTEMSGFNNSTGIVVIGATNRLDTLDEALLRPGRFDRQIEIGLPDINSRKQILALHAKGKPFSDRIDFDELAKSTVYFSGAMLENLLNEAAIYAANDNQPVINTEHMDKAFYTVIAGSPKKDRSYISEQERQITAYHEAGHALITKLLLSEHFISKVTIIPSVKGAGGFNLSIPKESQFMNKSAIQANIMMLLGGRAAEEIMLGEDHITTGASNDIQKASSMIVDYINRFGMDKDMGIFSMEVLDHHNDAQLIEKCRDTLNHLYKNTLDIMNENRNLLIKITEELLKKETLSGNEIDLIIKGVSNC